MVLVRGKAGSKDNEAKSVNTSANKSSNGGEFDLLVKVKSNDRSVRGLASERRQWGMSMLENNDEIAIKIDVKTEWKLC